MNVASKLSSFLAELKRRKVYHVGLAYAAVAAGVVGVCDAGIPDLLWARLQVPVGVLLLVGFPVALVLAWAYEIRPEEPQKVEKDRGGTAESSIAGDRESIVVLPFDNMSPDPGDAYLADGLTEELIAELSAIRDLRVISRTTAMKLKDTGKDVGTIGRELHVQYVLEGSVRKLGENLRITAQLIDASNDEHLAVERYSGTMDDVFEIQERLARKIVDQLEVKLRPEEDDRLTTPRISHALAYQYYLGAKRHLVDYSQEAQDKAIRLLKRALEIEGPNEFLYTAMGVAQTRYSFGGRSMDLVEKEAERWAAKVFELNPDSPGGHVLKGSVLLQQGRNQEAAMSFKQALRSDPDNSDALLWLAFIAGCSGHLAKARSYYQRLISVDPMAEGINAEWVSYYSGEFDAAVEGYRIEYEMDPQSPYTRWTYGMCLAWAGRVEEGCKILERIVEDSPETPFGVFERFCIPALRSDPEEALAGMTPALEDLGKSDVQFSWMIGVCYANLGMVDEAATWLRQAMDRGFINYPFLAEKEPFLAGVRSEPQIQEVLDEMKERWKVFEP